MPGLAIRAAQVGDLRRLMEIYNHYVVHLPATFDLEAKTLEERQDWFGQFAETGRHRLLVAEVGGLVLGYTGTMRWRPKPAYDTTVETTIYCAPESVGRGVGAQLYAALFDAIAGEEIHRIVAGFVPPNPASAALHERFGFRPVGVFGEVGYKAGTGMFAGWRSGFKLLGARCGRSDFSFAAGAGGFSGRG
ncbi:MAG: N-acetyltransferase family protein [Acidobacteriaceae bacterium]